MSTPDPDATARIGSDAFPRTPPRRGVEAQFAPGTLIAGRYRISGLLGAGGMGEVYRAEDTKLDQLVALKFLPARFARDPVLLARLHDEVRHGRQIAHPNVCRIYDIGESGATHFVAMEYVDGEDLSRLLRRIGRLAPDKAIEITRGITAGLMAAHAKGILHRDLKPANVMIDARGDARIMDFGLALAAGEDDGTIAGTPAYMAPEQLAGQPATVQSDLYALGLVMYELFTGRRAHDVRTLPERVRDLDSDVTVPSELIRDIEPHVEKTILRCLHHDSTHRPRSAREVLLALPGGDPLAAAVAAGETPSPRIVAAAPVEGSLRPAIAWALLATIFVATFVAVAGARRFSVTHYVSFETEPAVFNAKAASVLDSLGVPRQPYAMNTYRQRSRFLSWLLRNRATQTWERLRGGPPVATFIRVESSQPYPPGTFDETRLQNGTNLIELDPRGRLVALTAIPATDIKPRALDWKPLFAAAGIDPQRLTSAEPHLLPSAPADVRMAWDGKHPDDGTPIHIEAAAWRGTPVFFTITGEWDRKAATNIPFAESRTQGFATALMLIAITAALLLAWRNVRIRRGDRQGAIRIAATMFVFELATSLLFEDHFPSAFHEVAVLRRSVADALLWALVMFVLYLALEPIVRRRWPALLIASSRLAAGNVRDPLVGRDVLIGVTAGLLHPAIIMAGRWIFPNDRVARPFMDLYTLLGLRYEIGNITSAISNGLLVGFVIIVLLVLCMLVLRRPLPSGIALCVIFMIGYYFALAGFSVATTLVAILLSFVATRFGLLAMSVAQITFACIFSTQLFAGATWSSIQPLPILFVIAVAVWAFRTSLGGQRAFSARLIDG